MPSPMLATTPAPRYRYCCFRPRYRCDRIGPRKIANAPAGQPTSSIVLDGKAVRSVARCPPALTFRIRLAFDQRKIRRPSANAPLCYRTVDIRVSTPRRPIRISTCPRISRLHRWRSLQNAGPRTGWGAV